MVGAGPVGLTAALELGRRGVRVLVLERSEEIAREPRAQLVNAATMEHFRRLGVSRDLADSVLLGAEWPLEVTVVARGSEVLASRDAFTSLAAGVPGIAAEEPLRVPQFVTTRVLEHAVASLPCATIRRGVEVSGVSPAGETLKVVTDAGNVAARYVVGCDGANSVVRQSAGIEMSGTPALSHQLGVFFSSQALGNGIGGRRSVMYPVVDEQAPGVLGPVAPTSWWFQRIGVDPGVPPDVAREQQILSDLLGPSVDVTVDRVVPWTAHLLVADQYKSGQVLLAGDAAHLAPPTGGHNMNTGVGDAVNLGWKLAAVIQGWASPALLDSYETERRPVGQRIVDESGRNAMALAVAMRNALAELAARPPSRPEIGERFLESTEHEWISSGTVLDIRYDCDGALVADGSLPPEYDSRRARPAVRPGHRLPHRSTAGDVPLQDRCGLWFTILGGGRWALDVFEVLDRRGVPVSWQPEVTASPEDGRAALIRPDLVIGAVEGSPATPRQIAAMVTGSEW